MAIRAMTRPARITSSEMVLDAEYRAARYIYNRLLDFEDQHQIVLDSAAEIVAPGIVRVARIIARLRRRAKRLDRSTEGTWSPNPRPELLAALLPRLASLRSTRNASDAWKGACKWADTPAADAPDRGGIRRKASESDADFAARSEKRRNKLTRREAWRKALYDAHVAEGATERSRVYWGTWNALLKSVDQARAAVLKLRKSGAPAEWRRPRWDSTMSLAADAGGFRIVEKGHPWWTVELRLSSGWARFRCKFGNWHEIPDGAEFRTCKLTRRFEGRRPVFSCSICVGSMPEERTFATDAEPGQPGKRELLDGRGMVALDWGHREHGHPGEQTGLRVFTLKGDDGKQGQILLPVECRELLDFLREEQSRIDSAFLLRRNSLHLPEKNRHSYRARLLRNCPLRQEESNWLQWEKRRESRMWRARRRIQHLRTETYTVAARMLRQCYGVFAIEDETIVSHRKTDLAEQTRHRKRQNRELSARYEFVQLCERFGAQLLPVSARNSTRECPRCGHLGENTADLLMVCSECGTVSDKDYRACETILRRAREALANEAA